MQTQRFQITPQLFVMIGIVLLALALPVGLVIWSFVGWRSGEPEREAPPELRDALTAIAEKGLPLAAVDSSGREMIFTVPDVSKAAGLIASVAQDLGGTSLEGTPEGGNLRVLVSIQADKLPEFVRQSELITGKKISTPMDEEFSGMIGITLVPAGKP